MLIFLKIQLRTKSATHTKTKPKQTQVGLLNSSGMFLGGKLLSARVGGPGFECRSRLSPSTSWRELQSCRIHLKNHHQTSCAPRDFLPSCEFIQAGALRLLSVSPHSHRCQLKTSLRARKRDILDKNLYYASQLFVDFDFLSLASTPFVFVRTRCASSPVFHSGTRSPSPPHDYLLSNVLEH